MEPKQIDYGRYLGYLWYDSTGNKDYKMYNEEVVREGLARVGYIYDAVRHLDKMKEAQYKAKKSKKNIWKIMDMQQIKDLIKV